MGDVGEEAGEAAVGGEGEEAGVGAVGGAGEEGGGRGGGGEHAPLLKMALCFMSIAIVRSIFITHEQFQVL